MVLSALSLEVEKVTVQKQTTRLKQVQKHYGATDYSGASSTGNIHPCRLYTSSTVAPPPSGTPIFWRQRTEQPTT
jgi:hypothetical protein